jgi:inner membrane protein
MYADEVSAPGFRGKRAAILSGMGSLATRVRALVERPAPLALALAVVGLAGADWGSQLAGSSFIPGGPLDETAHLLTTLLVLWALGPRLTRRLMIPALAASVLIDLDHVPQYLGDYFFTLGTPRPYTHSLSTVLVVLALAGLWRRRRHLWLGVALGLVLHFWRDLAEPGSGVALLWPVSDHAFWLPHWSYLMMLAGIALIALVSGGGTPHGRLAVHAARGPEVGQPSPR